MVKVCASCHKFVYDEKLIDDEGLCLFCREQHIMNYDLIDCLRTTKHLGGFKESVYYLRRNRVQVETVGEL